MLLSQNIVITLDSRSRHNLSTKYCHNSRFSASKQSLDLILSQLSILNLVKVTRPNLVTTRDGQPRHYLSIQSCHNSESRFSTWSQSLNPTLSQLLILNLVKISQLKISRLFLLPEIYLHEANIPFASLMTQLRLKLLLQCIIHYMYFLITGIQEGNTNHN